jgi:hypothetical protein
MEISSRDTVNSLRALSIERRSAEFALVRVDENGVRSEFALSGADLVFLPRVLGDALKGLAVSRVSDDSHAQGIVGIAAVLVTEVELNVDVFGSVILLTLKDEFGNKSGFAVPCAVAKPLSLALVRRVEEVCRIEKTRTLKT